MQDEKLLERQQSTADKVCPENVQAIVSEILEVPDGRGMDIMQILEKSNVPVAEVLMGFIDRQPDNSEVEDFLWRIRVAHTCKEELMMKGVQAVIVRLHAKRKAVADCDQTIATQQLVCRLYSQAALLEEYVNAYKSEEEEYARRCALQEAEELRKKQKAMEELRAAIDQPCCRRLAIALDACDAIGLPEEELASAEQELSARQQRYMEEPRAENEKARAAFRAEQTQEYEVDELEREELIARGDEAEMRKWLRAVYARNQAPEHEDVELDEPIARDDETETRKRTAQQKKKTSKGGGVAASPKEGDRPVERRGLMQRLGLFSEIRRPKE